MDTNKDNEPNVTSATPLDTGAVATAEPPVVTFLDDNDEETEVAEGNEVEYDRLYTFLLDNEDIIITIDEADVEDLRRGLSVAKYSNNTARKRANAAIDVRQIDFKVLERIPDTAPQQVQLQIWLKAKKSVHLHRLVVSDKGL